MIIQLELTWGLIIEVFSFTTAFVLGLLFITSSSENKKANVFLGLSLLALSVEVLHVLLQNFELFFNEEWIMPSLFTIPFLLLYVLKTINHSFDFKSYFLLLPGVCLTLIPTNNTIIRGVEYLFNGMLLCYILFFLKEHREKVNNYYSDLENVTLKWIKLIAYIFLGFHVFWIFEDIIFFYNEDTNVYCASISSILTLVMIFWIGHKGFSQPEIFKNKKFIEPIALPEKVVEAPIERQEDIEQYDALYKKIETEQLYLDSKLNLHSLSEALGLSKKELSRLINQQGNCNFYQFINQFRVNEFKKLLQSPKAAQLSLLGLAQEAGFGSKSTFYSAFKAIEGMSPKQYELSLKKSE